MPVQTTGRAGAILLSFDVEEFDIALQYGRAVSVDEQFAVGAAGFDRILGLLEQHPARPRATFFTTAVFADRFPDLVRRAVGGENEIASHGFTHGPLEPGDLERSKATLERVCGTPVFGFRRARMDPTDARAVAAAGYLYNSSEHPVWLPGRYNNFFRPRRPYREGSRAETPARRTKPSLALRATNR